mmetsp:Transcript_36012/g.86246  ORF Transcript_36012/g.86246 Transcript_36012/m.86246 type:complete len:236 (-) Transcript_36012:631-1338(-)
MVPHMVILSADVTTLASPKSVSLASSQVLMRMFSGFTSRYTMSLSWRYAKASITSPMYLAARAGSRPRCLPPSPRSSHNRRLRSVGHSSKSKAKYLSKAKARCRWTMKGCSARCSAKTSEEAWRWLCCSWSFRANLWGICWRRQMLLAASRGSSTSMTRPKPPRPSSLTLRSAPNGTEPLLSSRARARRPRGPAALETTRELTDCSTRGEGVSSFSRFGKRLLSCRPATGLAFTE